MKLTIYNQVLEVQTSRGVEPRIAIQGALLPEFGFVAGISIKVELEQGKITITKRRHGDTRP